MRKSTRILYLAAPVVGAAIAVATAAGTGHAGGLSNLLDLPFTMQNPPSRTWGGDLFPKVEHSLLPIPEGERVAYGKVTDETLEQPIEFPHNLHAGTLNIQCEYCHSTARRSIHAGVPPTEVCMNCHKMVDSTGRPELEKLKEYWESGQPIPWKKVHDLPDFVYFSHKRHVLAGVQCQECHGQVQKDFTVARRVNTLLMGWCLRCHETHPSVDTNYGAQASLRRTELKDCWTCHK